MGIPASVNGSRAYNIHRALKENIKEMILPRYSGIAEDVLQALVKGVARKEGGLSIEAVSSRLNMSPGVLSNALCDSGVMFDSVLLDVRRHFGVKFVMALKDSDEIARILHYDSAMQFDAAFSTWMGVPPRQFRQFFDGGDLSFLGAA